ncbi:uncharacterized protein N0V89_006664 [Didymosphaeria variabile]|uniref:Uncharacterized protein n=1 Tax=Didymosphaeria variabile TaxID=1932322 RepID=A0A9W9C9G7_9PLEO|nr:uncharacterized protein N0V89_006664 [Didymosphaeria variabile]KAJ4351325.1 hypothetical protein N0V89_006664 [Didymosphaeria variabile]
MPSLKLTLLSAAAALATATANEFGPAFSTGPVSSGNFIRESTYTIVVPQAPTSSSDDLALWIGMGTSSNDLIQTIVDNTPQDGWTTFAYTLVGGTTPVSDKRTKTTAGHQIVTHCKPLLAFHTTSFHLTYESTDKYSDSTKQYTQTVLLDGKQVSTLSTASGQAQGWGTAVECQSSKCGTAPAHKWTNATIVMDKADPNYINTLYKSGGATGTMKTADGGKTWTVAEISVPSYTF